MNFTHRGTIGGDSTMQIRLWRQGKKTVADFDREWALSRRVIKHGDELLQAAVRERDCRIEWVGPVVSASGELSFRSQRT